MSILAMRIGFAFILSSTLTYAQSTKSAVSLPVIIRVVHALRTFADHAMEFELGMKGGQYSIDARNANALGFSVEAEGGSQITMHFPSTATLYLVNNPGYPSATIPFTRLTVTTSTVNYGRSSSATFLNQGVEEGTISIPGTLFDGLYQPKTRWFWVGGQIDIPVSIPSDMYRGSYTVTVTNYSN